MPGWFTDRALPLLHPVLFAVFPVLSLFAQNQSEVDLSVIWLPLIAAVLVALIAYGLCVLLTRQAQIAGVLTTLFVVALFYFGLFADRTTTWRSGVQLALWLGVFAALGGLVLLTKRPLGLLTLILTVTGAVLVVPRTIDIASYQHSHPTLSASDPRLWPTSLEAPHPAPGKRPDIYVLIPDDYARADVLAKYFHYDDRAFAQALTRRGFTLSSQARSPYSDSESNIASALNMDYLSQFPKVLGKDSQDVRPVKRVEQDNRAARLLGEAGYHYIHLDTDEVTFAGRNPDISPLAPPDSFANLWLRKSVLGPVGGRIGFNRAATDARFRASIDRVFGELSTTPQTPSPKLVVFHTLLPHDPYIYDARGGTVTFPSGSEDDLGNKLGMGYYLEQLKHVQSRLLGAIDVIRARSQTPPVIVVQSDEGFEANPDYLGERNMQDVRVKGLIALSLPLTCRAGARVPEPPNTVNTLRFVFNRCLGTHYPLLRSTSYPEGDLPYQYEAMRVRR
jgi:hypothetical protein